MAARKVLHLITGLERGGAEAVLIRLVANGDRTRFASVVVSLTDEGGFGPAIRAAGIPLHVLGMRRGRPSVSGMARLLRLLRREKPELMMSWLYHADLAALIAASLAPGPILLWNLRCSAMDLAQYSLQARVVRRVLAAFSGRPAAVIVNSEAGRAFHESIGYRPRRWEIVPNGFDIAVFRPDDGKRAEWRKRLDVAGAAPLVGMVARVDPMKDHATFLAAATRIAAARPDAAFMLVGAGTEKLVIPPALSGRVSFLGERDDVADILAALDLFMLTSAFGEGFPNVIGEAMATGVPVVATDVGDVRRIIGGTGTVSPPRDPEALAAAALAVLALGPAARHQRGDAARKRIIETYSLAAMVAAYERIFAEPTG